MTPMRTSVKPISLVRIFASVNVLVVTWLGSWASEKEANNCFVLGVERKKKSGCPLWLREWRYHQQIVSFCSTVPLELVCLLESHWIPCFWKTSRSLDCFVLFDTLISVIIFNLLRNAWNICYMLTFCSFILRDISQTNKRSPITISRYSKGQVG